MADEQRDIIEVLTHDHREVDAMFVRLHSTADKAARKDLADEIAIELVRHSVAEEQWLYPTVRDRIEGGAQLADRELAEHAVVENLLKDIGKHDPDQTRFDDQMTALMANVRQHVVEEESELFPQLRAVCTDDELRDLGAKIEKTKRHAPTRPHPRSPSQPPANKILGPGVALLDRLRDKLTGRG